MPADAIGSRRRVVEERTAFETGQFEIERFERFGVGAGGFLQCGNGLRDLFQRPGKRTAGGGEQLKIGPRAAYGLVTAYELQTRVAANFFGLADENRADLASAQNVGPAAGTFVEAFDGDDA